MFEGINGAIQIAVIDMILVFTVLGGLALVMVCLKNMVGIKEVKLHTVLRSHCLYFHRLS